MNFTACIYSGPNLELFLGHQSRAWHTQVASWNQQTKRIMGSPWVKESGKMNGISAAKGVGRRTGWWTHRVPAGRTMLVRGRSTLLPAGSADISVRKATTLSLRPLIESGKWLIALSLRGRAVRNRTRSRSNRSNKESAHVFLMIHQLLLVANYPVFTARTGWSGTAVNPVGGLTRSERWQKFIASEEWPFRTKQFFSKCPI